jgi:3',5'-cyclic AMP phosphodiesterase CpdA
MIVSEPGAYTPDLAFIHLSDIHFRIGRLGDAHDEDMALRNELELDLRRVRIKVPHVDGLIVSGDIAFSGQPDEYAYAAAWLKSIREQLGCKLEGVMVTPGNHDVDRTAIPKDGPIDLLQQNVRGGASMQERDDRLAAILRDPDRGDLLLRPLSTYNAFAGSYGCQISRVCPHWERDFILGDGTAVRFRGITTTLLSGLEDDHETHRMFYGGAQRTILRVRNVRYALVGHHPPSWTLEGDNADQIFSTLSFLQVFGHKHEQWQTRLGNSVRFIAGAVHPSRNEQNWDPRYAVIGISAIDERHLAIRIYPRVWSGEELMFIGDYNSMGHDYRDYTVDVELREI